MKPVELTDEGPYCGRIGVAGESSGGGAAESKAATSLALSLRTSLGARDSQLEAQMRKTIGAHVSLRTSLGTRDTPESE